MLGYTFFRLPKPAALESATSPHRAPVPSPTLVCFGTAWQLPGVWFCAFDSHASRAGRRDTAATPTAMCLAKWSRPWGLRHCGSPSQGIEYSGASASGICSSVHSTHVSHPRRVGAVAQPSSWPLPTWPRGPQGCPNFQRHSLVPANLLDTSERGATCLLFSLTFPETSQKCPSLGHKCRGSYRPTVPAAHASVGNSRLLHQTVGIDQPVRPLWTVALP